MTETNRKCARCKQTLPKKKYSKNQWSKGINKSKCKGCVSDKLIPKELFMEKSSAKNKLKRFMKRKVGKKKQQQQEQAVAVVSDTEEEGNCSTEACIPLPAVIWSRSMTYLPASDFLNTLTTNDVSTHSHYPIAFHSIVSKLLILAILRSFAFLQQHNSRREATSILNECYYSLIR